MDKKKLKIIIIIILVAIVATILIYTSTRNNFKISDTKAKADITGKNLGLLTITKDNLKTIKIIDKNVDGNTSKVTANINIEYTDKGAGNLNKFYKKNDIIHYESGTVYLNYSKHGKEWQLDNISNFESLKDKTKEIETSIKIIPFKSENDVLADLKNSNMGISVTDSITCTLTYGKNDAMGYTPITKVNEFKLQSAVEKDTEVWKLATISTDVDFDINVPGDMFSQNGHYNATGTFQALYQLQEDKQGNPVWSLSSIMNFPKMKIVKQ